MKAILFKRVHIAWLLIILAVGTSIVIIWQVTANAPPANSVLISSSDDAGASVGGAAPRSETQSISAQQATPSGANKSSVNSTAVINQQMAGVDPKNGVVSMAVSATGGVIEPTSTPGTLVVYISGAVQKPGVYTLPAGSRIADGLGAAGGPATGADLNSINLAEHLSDEEHISVPRIDDTPVAVAARQTPASTPRGAPQREGTFTSQPKSVPVGKININTASAEELEALPGIGPSLAGKIVKYRVANGPFRAIEDLMQVPGIKQGVFSKLRDSITVGP